MTASSAIACVQMDCVPCDVESNLAKLKSFLLEAKRCEAELVVIPELFNIGYDLEQFKLEKNYDVAATTEFLAAMSKELQLFIVAGLADSDGDRLYNSAFVFNNRGEIVCKYNKMNLFPLSDESSIFVEGNQTATFSFGGFTAGLLICYDIRFPELGIRYYHQGCNLLIVMSAFPFPRLDHWRTLLKARAIENQSYVVAANRVGQDGELRFLGNSSIIDPWGTVKAALDETEEGVIIQEIKLDKVQEVRGRMDHSDNKTRLIRHLRSGV